MKDRKKAVALTYKRDVDDAPKVVAGGKGQIADRIISIARKSGVSIHSDEDLVEVLEALDVDTEIPESLYQAVAEVLLLIYEINRNFSLDRQNICDAAATTEKSDGHCPKL